ncbi:MAG: hypothetical protein PWR27_1319 [Petroclostridium sp.]|jgi:predicted glycogen debranching enzyme|uniref:amylo-alpha-1,6-glucosidase n=1 Tax=Petroclostridium xylanilyticum TaxID=1792311 RepID=UPI000B980CA1|nr:amylo-alpha-1,6-glucosidase [Petroclostridium xylanilyticum]MBZ4646613.1 glycogen debranching enzyme [Clostridia bacterium]MDK2810610.1 hypothetical protein [Petroclostridium sp.]
MEFGKDSWRTFEQGIQREWLLTNGIGGFSSSTIIGANTRRYHGLLIASLKPPVMRHLILSKLDESIIINGISYNLYTNQTIGHISEGYLYQQRFIMDPIPTYVYNVEDIFIEKKICMVYGENKIIIMYKIIPGERGCKLKIAPLVNFRDYHFNSSKSYLNFEQREEENGTVVRPQYYDIDIFLNISEGRYIKQDDLYFYNMDYAIERERGLHSIEDHYIPGLFEVEINPGKEKYITITAGIGQQEKLDGNRVIEAELNRINSLVNNAGYQDDFVNSLVKACDNFIVYRESTHSKTVIAGYPWFTDWGRDTMISLPGLTLVTKRYDDAKNILYTFSHYIKHGLIPNMFPDAGEEPGYNTVDAALWYIHAVYKYLQYTGDYEFIKTNIYERLKEIIDSYAGGTLYNIKMDDDGLISAGSSAIQLTWMDAKIGDWVVTSRHGKAVEVNALWYNALNIMAHISGYFGENNFRYLEIASRVKISFEKQFWNEKKQCLFDIVNEEGKDDKIRPNQIFAMSLAFPIIEGEKARHVVNVVLQQLYATYGLRSLSPLNNEYIGIYAGDQFKRDAAYHQGTAWSWLIGHFITAYRKTYNYSEESRQFCLNLIRPFKDHLKDACVGSISEIFDGNPPNIPRGCFAQAWGVAEVLRAYVEDILLINERPNYQ